jgi:hypothetical protein
MRMIRTREIKLCALAGTDLQEGVSGFGNDVPEALIDLVNRIRGEDTTIWVPRPARQFIEDGVVKCVCPECGHYTEMLIARAVDSVTGQWMMVIAGMGEKGGAAATEFVTEPDYLERLARLAPRDWDRRNIEVVIQTKLVDGDWAAPRIVASHFW